MGGGGAIVHSWTGVRFHSLMGSVAPQSKATGAGG